MPGGMGWPPYQGASVSRLLYSFKFWDLCTFHHEDSDGEIVFNASSMNEIIGNGFITILG